MGTAMFGSQVGQALASLAGEVVSGSDIGLPLGPEGKAVLLPANVDAFTEGLEIDIEQVRLYLALREAAYQRLFSHVPWLKPRLLGAVEEYARGITVDASKFSELAQQAEQMDLTNLDPSQLENMLGGGGLFQPVDSPAQKAALARLETLLALAEGWVDAVVHAAAGAAAVGGGRAARDAAPAPRGRRSGRADVLRAGRPGAAPAPAAGRLPAVGVAGRRARGGGARRGVVAPGPAADLGGPGRPGRVRARPGRGRRGRDGVRLLGARRAAGRRGCGQVRGRGRRRGLGGTDGSDKDKDNDKGSGEDKPKE